MGSLRTGYSGNANPMPKKKAPTDRLSEGQWGLKPMAGLQEPCRGAPKLQYHKKTVVESKKIGGDAGDDQGVKFYHGTTTPDGITSGHSIGP
jgi:hypothetical protein